MLHQDAVHAEIVRQALDCGDGSEVDVAAGSSTRRESMPAFSHRSRFILT
jgi:hypothetical protein